MDVRIIDIQKKSGGGFLETPLIQAIGTGNVKCIDLIEDWTKEDGVLRLAWELRDYAPGELAKIERDFKTLHKANQKARKKLSKVLKNELALLDK